MSEETYKIALTAKQVEGLDGTGVMQGTEEPGTRAEMVAAMQEDGSVKGPVSWSTLSWLMGALLSWSDAAADGEDFAEKASARGAVKKVLKVYEAAGGDARAYAPRKVEEEPQEPEQAPELVTPPAPPVPDPETPLTDEEKDALGMAIRNTNEIPHRCGVLLKTAKSLEARGYLKLHVWTSGRKWHGRLTELGEAAAQAHRDFILAPKEDVKKATSAVAMELFKERPGLYMSEACEIMDYSSVEAFTRSVKFWLSDKSELRQAQMDAADYRELYVDFSEHQGLTPNLLSSEGPKQREAVTAAEVPSLPGVVLPEDAEGAAMVVDAVTKHLGIAVPAGIRVEDVPGLSNSGNAEALGKPVKHAKTGEIVGYLKRGKFTPVSPD